MSGEIENNDEEEKVPQKQSTFSRWFTRCLIHNWHIGFKLLELAMAAACIGCIYYPSRKTGVGKFNNDNIGIIYTTYIGSIITILGFATGRVLRERLSFKTSVVFSVTYAALFLITGILLIVEKAERTKLYYFHPTTYLLNLMIIAIVFSFLAALTHLVDAILTFIKRQDF